MGLTRQLSSTSSELMHLTTSQLVDIAIKQAHELRSFYFIDENYKPEACDERTFLEIMKIINHHKPMKQYIKTLVKYQVNEIRSKSDLQKNGNIYLI